MTLQCIGLFLQKVIVPLAVATNAIVIVCGLNKCALTNAMGVIASILGTSAEVSSPSSCSASPVKHPFRRIRNRMAHFPKRSKKPNALLDSLITLSKWHLDDYQNRDGSYKKLWFSEKGSLYEKSRFHKM